MVTAPTDISIAQGHPKRLGLGQQREALKTRQVDGRRSYSSAARGYFSNTFHSSQLLLLLLSLPRMPFSYIPPNLPLHPDLTW